MTMSAGWFRARARPWNEVITDPMVRVDRGGAEFLHAVTTHLHEIGVDSVYSPALYGGSTGIWSRSGFVEFATLEVMERALNGASPGVDTSDVAIERDPDWDEVLEVDRSSFEGFWGMSRLGLQEAHATNRSTALLVIRDGSRLAGYAIVGSQWGTVYLHRIAVGPDDSGRGLGAALLAGSIEWGNGSGGRSMVLNVRQENARAVRLYERLGFTDTGSALRVLRHGRG